MYLNYDPHRLRLLGSMCALFLSLSVVVASLGDQSLCWADKSGEGKTNPSSEESRSGRGQAIPAPPPLIAPTGLFSESDMMLTPDQVKERETSYKSEADTYYARGDYRKALVSLQRAYLISKQPRYIANQGLVFEKMQRYSDAIKALEYYLLTAPPADLARSAQQVINRLSPEVKIETDPPGAQVIIGQKVMGQTPFTSRLIAGEHPLELSLSGYDVRKVTLFVIPGKPVFAQYKLDLSANALTLESSKEPTKKEVSRAPMNTVQSSAMILGGLTLGLSATSFWFTREAVISRDQAVNRTSWEIAQNEASLFNSITYTTASIGMTALVGGLSWWLFSSPESPRMIDPINQIPYPLQRTELF